MGIWRQVGRGADALAWLLSYRELRVHMANLKSSKAICVSLTSSPTPYPDARSSVP